MKEIPNLPTCLVITEGYIRGKWFIHNHLHIVEQRNSHNFIACFPDNLEKKIHFRIITDPNDLIGLKFHDYILHGPVSDQMLDTLDRCANRMRQEFNLGMVE